MANSLLDTLRQNLQGGAQAQPTLGQGDQAASLLRTKLTGKTETPGGDIPRQSSLAEQSAAQGIQAQSNQLGMQGSIQSQQLGQQSADQEQAAGLAKQQELQNRELKSQQFAQQASSLAQDFQRQGKSLQTSQDLAQLEQIAFATRLANTQYINQLQNEAAQSGIDNDAKFKEEYYKQVFADAQSIFQGNIDFKTLTATDDRTFSQEMAKMSLETAYDLARKSANEENLRGQYGAVGSLASGGLQAYGTYSQSQAKPGQ